MEKPIIFSAPMVRAILAGRKTQTRRVIKNILPAVQRIEPNGPNSWAMFGNNNGWTIECPYGIPGNHLWVRESWGWITNPDTNEPITIYAADWPNDDFPVLKRPSIHMPRWASRLTLEITAVRVERLHAIGEDDAQAEGIAERTRLPSHEPMYAMTFAKLWDEINAKRGYPWVSNPFVWVIEFKRIIP
jgi:hypothetical protein